MMATVEIIPLVLVPAALFAHLFNLRRAARKARKYGRTVKFVGCPHCGATLPQGLQMMAHIDRFHGDAEL
jgi:hypothetical protein